MLQWITCSTLEIGHTKQQIISSKPLAETRNRSLSWPKVFSKTEISFLSSWNLDICLFRAQIARFTQPLPHQQTALFTAFFVIPLTKTRKIIAFRRKSTFYSDFYLGWVITKFQLFIDFKTFGKAYCKSSSIKIPRTKSYRTFL